MLNKDASAGEEERRERAVEPLAEAASVMAPVQSPQETFQEFEAREWVDATVVGGKAESDAHRHLQHALSVWLSDASRQQREDMA